MFRLLKILAIAACLGCAHQAASETNISADASDSAQIYSAFLDSWTGEKKNKINVSIRAGAPSIDTLKEFSDCSSGVQWAPVEPINDLTGLIGNLSYVHLIDPDKWAPVDPRDLIAQGQSVESAVDSGFNSGLARLSAIAFDETRTTAAFTFSFVCGSLCGGDRTLIYKRTSSGWAESDNQCGSWISQVSMGRPNNSFKPTPLHGVA